MALSSIATNYLVICLALLNIMTGGHLDCCAPLHVFEGERHESYQDASLPCVAHGFHTNPVYGDSHHSDHNCQCASGDDSHHEHYCGGAQPILNVNRVLDHDHLYKLTLSPLFVKVQLDEYKNVFAQSYDDTSVFETDALKVRLNVLYEVFLI